MPDHPPDLATLEPRHLIALNCDLDLSREAVCSLARSAEPWWRADVRASKTDARRLGVRRGELAMARATLAWADKDLKPAESQVLLMIAEAFAINDERARDLIDAAK